MIRFLWGLIAIPLTLLALGCLIAVVHDPKPANEVVGVFVALCAAGAWSKTRRRSSRTVSGRGGEARVRERRTSRQLLADLDRSELGSEHWHGDPVSERQRAVLEDHAIAFDPKHLTKGEASLIIERLFEEDDSED